MEMNKNKPYWKEKILTIPEKFEELELGERVEKAQEKACIRF